MRRLLKRFMQRGQSLILTAQTVCGKRAKAYPESENHLRKEHKRLSYLGKPFEVKRQIP